MLDFKKQQSLLKLDFLFCTGEVQKKFGTMRNGLRKSLAKFRAWNTLPSGSAARPKTKPKPYKYTAEMDFLAAVALQNPTLDSGNKME